MMGLAKGSSARLTADVAMKNAAAAALVDVAASLPIKHSPSETTKSSTIANHDGNKSSCTSLLPTNTAGRRQWDQEQAAPPPDFPETSFYTTKSNGNSNSVPSLATARSVAGGTKCHSFTANSSWTSQSEQAQQGQQAGRWGAPPPAKPPVMYEKAATPPNATKSSGVPPSILLSMTSIGFGIDSACAPVTSSGDATVAAKNALRDAMARSAVRLPTADSSRENLSIHLKIGVPPRKNTGKPMFVDTSELLSLLPPSVQVAPIELVVGGLMIDQLQQGQLEAMAEQPLPTICTAVACVTIQQSVFSNEQNEAAAARASASTSLNHNKHASGQQQPQSMHTVRSPTFPTRTPFSSPNLGAMNHEPPSFVHVPHRTKSMEMLAMVSGEIRERQLMNNQNNRSSAMAAIQQQAAEFHGVLSPASQALAMLSNTEVPSFPRQEQQMQQGADASVSSNGSGNANNSAYSYKKLAPGMTPKNNKRLFVKHHYRDYSLEAPLPDEQYLVRSEGSRNRTPNAAFPLKLHETLTQIEQDGYDHIVGWLPHGRSFKIHKQAEFVSVVLPKYFVMTKKSSFLRQLNLYNFNRLTGEDSGSYYHEKFLRGLKFLCRRMTRQKVNGNGIRAAGNPDDEPVLSRYPTCPPPRGGNSRSSSVAEDTAADANSQARFVDVAPRPLHSASSHGDKDSTLVTDENASHGSNGSGRAASNRTRQSKAARPDPSGATSSTVSQASFPLKLQRILDQAEATGKKDIISWQGHGRAFLVHDSDRFVNEVVSKYFSQTKYSSFQRQLHMYNFKRITGLGRDKGAYHHPLFQRGKPELCLTMSRTRVNGKGCRRPGDPDTEPDLYLLEPAPEVPRGSVVEIPMDGPLGLQVNSDEDMDTQE